MSHNDALRSLIQRYFPKQYKFVETDQTLLVEPIADNLSAGINEELKMSADTLIVEHLFDDDFFKRIIDGPTPEKVTVLRAICQMSRNERIQGLALFVHHYHQSGQLIELNQLIPFKTLSLETKLIYLNLLYDVYYRNRKTMEGKTLTTELIQDFTARTHLHGLWKELMNDIESSLYNQNKVNIALVGGFNSSAVGHNLLILTAACYPEKIKLIIDCVKNDPTQLEQLLTHQYDFGSNALMMASCRNPDAVKSILQAANAFNDIEQREDILIHMLTTRTIEGANALMFAAIYQPMAISPLLSAAMSLPEQDRVPVLQKMLTATLSEGANALMLAAHHQPTAVSPLLNAVMSLPEEDRETVLKTILMATFQKRNALMIAAGYHPENVPALLEAAKSLSNAGKAELRDSMKMSNLAQTRDLLKKLDETTQTTALIQNKTMN